MRATSMPKEDSAYVLESVFAAGSTGRGLPSSPPPGRCRLEELTPLAKTWDYDASALETLLRYSRATFSITLVVKLLPPHFGSQTSIQTARKPE